MCENENADGLTQALLEVIRNLRQYDSTRIRRHVEQHFDYQTIAARLDNLYGEVLGTSRKDSLNRTVRREPTVKRNDVNAS